MKFVRQNRSQKKRVTRTGWRKPRGIDNKLRILRRGYGLLPKIGYRGASAGRGFHPCGKQEVLVSNEKELLAVKDEAVRFSAKLGKRKYEALKKKAAELKLKVLN